MFRDVMWYTVVLGILCTLIGSMWMGLFRGMEKVVIRDSGVPPKAWDAFVAYKPDGTLEEALQVVQWVEQMHETEMPRQMLAGQFREFCYQDGQTPEGGDVELCRAFFNEVIRIEYDKP